MSSLFLVLDAFLSAIRALFPAQEATVRASLAHPPSCQGHLAGSPSPLLRDLQPGHPERPKRLVWANFVFL